MSVIQKGNIMFRRRGFARPFGFRRRGMRRRLMWRRGRWGRVLMMDTAALVLFGAAAYKFHPDHAQSIEADTRQSLENLTEEDLRDAMRRLGIKQLMLDDDDQVAITQADDPDFV